MHSTDARRKSTFHLQRILPTPVLRPFVECFWYIPPTLMQSRSERRYMHPRGGNGLVFNFSDQLTFDGVTVNASSFFDGTNTRSRELGLPDKAHAFGIRFRTGGMFSLFSIPINQLVNENCDLETISLPGARRVTQGIFDSESLNQMVNHVERWLLARPIASPEYSKRVTAAAKILEQQCGQIRIGSLADRINMGQRQLERLFQTYVGMTPKTLARLLRVHYARRSLSKRNLSLADISQLAGFTDQAHFTREFNAVVGLTPLAYMKRRGVTGAFSNAQD